MIFSGMCNWGVIMSSLIEIIVSIHIIALLVVLVRGARLLLVVLGDVVRLLLVVLGDGVRARFAGRKASTSAMLIKRDVCVV